MKTILCDCDGVLLDWVHGLRTYLEAEHNLHPIGEPQDWDMTDWIPGVDVKDYIKEFNFSPYFARLYSLLGAKSFVDRALSLGHQLHMLSACGTSPAVIASRRANIRAVFGSDAFVSLHCVSTVSSKEVELGAWRPGTLYIEDNFHNAMRGQAIGLETYLIKAPHNLEHREEATAAGIIVIDHLSEVPL